MADQEERRLLPVKLDTYKPLREVVLMPAGAIIDGVRPGKRRGINWQENYRSGRTGAERFANWS